jgi:hypothetical protein
MKLLGLKALIKGSTYLLVLAKRLKEFYANRSSRKEKN